MIKPGLSPDGSTVFVTGGSAGSTGDSDYATFASTTLWGPASGRRYNGSAHADDFSSAFGGGPRRDQRVRNRLEHGSH